MQVNRARQYILAHRVPLVSVGSSSSDPSFHRPLPVDNASQGLIGMAGIGRRHPTMVVHGTTAANTPNLNAHRSMFTSPQIVHAAVLPCMSNSSTPTQGQVPPERAGPNTWLEVKSVNFAMELTGEYGFQNDRSYSNAKEFCVAEWGCIEEEVLHLLREANVYDCFWLLKQKKAMPGNRATKEHKGRSSQWNQPWCPYPPEAWVKERGASGGSHNKFWSTGFEYPCDFFAQTGCPCKLRIMRDWLQDGDAYTVYVNDVLARHGCTHLLTTNELDSNMQAATTPALHAVVKILIQRRVLESGRPTPWSHHKAAAARLCFGTAHLHCRKGHMDSTQLQDLDDTATKKVFGNPSCKHIYVMDCLVRGLGGKRARSDVIVDGLPQIEAFIPVGRKELYFDQLKRADTSGDIRQYYRFANEYHSIASQVLPGGLGAMHAAVFSPVLDKQAKR